MPTVLAITGASGAAYAVRLLDVLLAAGREVHLTISPAGQAVLRHELGLEVNLESFRQGDLLGKEGRDRSTSGSIHYHHHQDLMSPIASGSFLTDGMVVCPCSGGTLAAIAHAMGTNLIHRAAEVHLKECRKLILMPRETPLSLPQLDNMKRAAEAGGSPYYPPAPAFITARKTINDLVDFVVGRICDQLGVEQSLIRRWGETV